MTTNNLRILLVDDDEHDNFFHKRAISKSGLDSEVYVCFSGLDALDYLQNKGNYTSLSSEQCKPDLIILDINMPHLNGWEFLEAYAALPDETVEKSSVIIIMLSTSSNPDTMRKALNTPYVADFIEKPLRAETVLELSARFFEIAPTGETS